MTKKKLNKSKAGAAILILAVIIVLAFTQLFSTGETIQGTETIKIGFMGPLTGDAASYGESIKNGVELANKDVNLELIFEDSKCEAKEAANAINKLISVDKVQAIIGGVCLGATLEAAPIATENKVPMVSSASKSPELSKFKEYIFRTVPSDVLQGAFGAELAFNKGFKKMAVLYGNEDYGVGFNNVLKDEFPKQGGEIVASETFERGAVDLRTQLTKIKEANPDVIYLISNSPDSIAAALSQIKELEIETQVIGSEGLKSDAILESAKESAEGMIVTSVSSGNEEFIEMHKSEYGNEPGPFAAQAYDALKAIAMTLEQGAKTGEDIAGKLKTLEFDGASGHIKFDENGDVSGNYEVYVVRDGKFVKE